MSLRADVVGVAVECAVCGQMKKPVGRSAPMGPCFCDDDCAGYDCCADHLERLLESEQ